MKREAYLGTPNKRELSCMERTIMQEFALYSFKHLSLSLYMTR